MRLKELSISGFKSFAKPITLAFPAPIAAIVGPNGSGKSNVAEAIRWVLGEQSMKSLRGKRGEDLIFHGTAKQSRLGKASVVLTLDNKDGALPIDFPEAVLERKIFRDGSNEYYLNDSQVRLKDISEILARMGLGETKHNLIGQGEVDRILRAPPKDRKTLLEEAIGLRIYEIRKRDASRKLASTETNMREVENLLRELMPHVRFLKSQAEKAQKRETIEVGLQQALGEYAARERAVIARERSDLAAKTPDPAALAALEREIARLISAGEPKAESEPADEQKMREQDLETLENRRRDLERELGRAEGRIESRHSAKGPALSIEAKAVEERLVPILESLRDIAGGSRTAEEIKDRVRALASDIERFLASLKKSGHDSYGAVELQIERDRIQQSLKALDAELKEARAKLGSRLQKVESLESSLRERWETIRKRETEANAVRVAVERSRLDRERLDMRERDLQNLLAENNFTGGNGPVAETNAAPEELRRKIEKLKIRLEEIGGIDEAVLREYQSTQSRYDFLSRELEDLKKASRDLNELISELEAKIETEFKAGFSRINDEFQHYVSIIFDGGSASLSYAAIGKYGDDNEAEENGDDSDEEGKIEYGVEIRVNLPRKRIKSLEMLSGGERALVSVALLFAITVVNPPPFLVLDETDAALDEANSQKYAKILSELAKKTQLVVITHNRETMKQAGVLYGVTMTEEGVSKLLSLKFDEAETYGNR